MNMKKDYDRFVDKFLSDDASVDDNMEDRDPEKSALENPSDSVSGTPDPDATPPAAALGQNSPSTTADEDTPGPEPENADSGPQVSGGGDPELRGHVIAAIREVYDPEIPLNIYDLGLIYRVDLESDSGVTIDMTLTSPHCPVAESLPGEVENAVRAVEGITDVQLELVWDPPWDMDRMGEAARLELGLM